jgi:hypothetical protein
LRYQRTKPGALFQTESKPIRKEHEVSTLTARDLQAILDIVYMVNDDQSEVEVSQQALAQLGALVGSESVSYSYIEHNPERRLLYHVHEPCSTDAT